MQYRQKQNNQDQNDKSGLYRKKAANGVARQALPATQNNNFRQKAANGCHMAPQASKMPQQDIE